MARKVYNGFVNGLDYFDEFNADSKNVYKIFKFVNLSPKSFQ